MLSRRAQAVLRDHESVLGSRDRYVDIGVVLRVVRRRGTDGELETVRTEKFGGIFDTAANRIVGESEQPQEWQCSEDQWAVIQHPDDAPPGILAIGGMGAGKTVAAVLWLYLRWLEHLGRGTEGGIVAPTAKRLNLVLREINRWPASWWRYQQSSGVVTLCDGTTLRCVSTTQKSAAAGSPLQGYSWSFAVADEIQDSVEQITHLQARLRSAANGRAKRLGTATAKDDPAWRDAKDQLITSGVWATHTLIGPRSPFVHPSHWESMRRLTTERDYRRLVLAEDLPSESRLYHTFSREHNIRPIPLGARKCTSIVLSRKTGDRRDALLIGHDPGAAKSASVWLEAYELPEHVARIHGLPANEVLWFARDELFTHNATIEEHAVQAMRITRDRFGCNMRPDAERAHVRSQPLGMAEDKPDMTVFAIWKRVGFDSIRAAQYSKQGRPVGQLKKEVRIGCINTLFCDAAGQRRLFIESGKCPLLIAALETMERDHRGRAEHEAKDIRHDRSDLPASLGYALHPFESATATALRADIRRELTA